MEATIVIVTVLVVLWIISAIMLGICLGRDKLYIRIFEPKMWKTWEKVISSFDTVQFERSFDYPELAGLEFRITVDGKDATITYWTKNHGLIPHLAVFLEDDTLTWFDKYHHNILVNMLREKFDFFPTNRN